MLPFIFLEMANLFWSSLGVIRMRGIPSELYRVYDGAACDDSC